MTKKRHPQVSNHHLLQYWRSGSSTYPLRVSPPVRVASAHLDYHISGVPQARAPVIPEMAVISARQYRLGSSV